LELYSYGVYSYQDPTGNLSLAGVGNSTASKNSSITVRRTPKRVERASIYCTELAAAEISQLLDLHSFQELQ
jgi:hypothetical protein